MKVLQVVHGFPPDRIAGTELYVMAISQGIQDRGHECHVLSGSGGPEGRLTSRAEHGIHVARLSASSGRNKEWYPAYNPEVEEFVRGYLKDLQPDVVHVHHWISLTANILALCHEMGHPTVLTLHDLASICPRIDRMRFDKVFCTDPLSTAPCVICVEREPWQGDDEVRSELAMRRQMIEGGLRLADRLLVPSRAQKEFLAGFLDVSADRLEVLPHGTPHDLKPRVAANRPISGGPLRIGHWGHLMWQKGPHLLIEAVRRLSDPRGVQVHLIGSAGDPAYRKELEDLAEGLPVTFHGAFTPRELEGLDLDVAVFPSLCHESHSFVLDEAFQLGLPVIVSDRGAMAERVGPAGLVFSAGVVEDLAARLEQLVADPALLESLRKAPPRDPPHSLAKHILALERIYGEVTRSKRETSVSRPDYRKILVLKQRQLAAREAAIVDEQVRYQQLQAKAREYQDRLERDLAKAQADYRQLHTEAQSYQAHLEMDLAKAQADYQHLQVEAQRYQAQLEEQVAAAQAAYQQLHTEAQTYQTHLEQDLEMAKAAYQQLLGEAQAYQAQLETDLGKAHSDYQQLQAEAREYQGRLESDLAKAQTDYQQLHARAQMYQARLERDLAKAHAEHQALHANLERQIRTLSDDRDRLSSELNDVLSHSVVKLYLKVWKRVFGSRQAG